MDKNYQKYLNKIYDIESSIDYINLVSENNLSLMQGLAGIALFYFELFGFTKRKRYYNKGIYLLDKIFNIINNNIEGIYNTFCDGIFGIGWLLNYLSKTKYIDNTFNKELQSIDQHAYKIALYYLENDNCDFLHGAFGCILYLIRRDEKETHTYLKNLIVKILDKKLSEEDLIWNDNTDKVSDEKYIYLGIAHGIAGKALIINELITVNYHVNKCKNLLNECINILEKSKNRSNDSVSIYPTIYKKNNKDSNSRLAWCHGDLGISYTYAVLGHSLNNKKLIELGKELCIETTHRKELSNSYVIDAGLCHGASGVALLYKKINTFYNSPKIEESYKFWRDQLFIMDKHNNIQCGYMAYLDKEWVKEFGLLGGISGIGLFLISEIHNSNQTWADCLML